MPKNPKPPQHHHFVAPCEYRRISDIKPRVKSRVWPGWAISQRIHPHFSFQLFNPPPLYPPSPWAPRMNHSRHSSMRKGSSFNALLRATSLAQFSASVFQLSTSQPPPKKRGIPPQAPLLPKAARSIQPGGITFYHYDGCAADYRNLTRMPKNPKPPQHHHFVPPCLRVRISRIHRHFHFPLSTFQPPPLS